jgi:hypothetical protein
MSPSCRRTGDAALGITETPLWIKNAGIVAECYNTAKFKELLDISTYSPTTARWITDA